MFIPLWILVALLVLIIFPEVIARLLGGAIIILIGILCILPAIWLFNVIF